MTNSDPLVKQMQEYLKAVKPLGMGYALPADGVMTPQFAAALGYLESALAAQGHKVTLLSGGSVNASGIAQLQEILKKTNPAPAADSQDKKPTEDKPVGNDPAPSPDALKNNAAWESFLGQSLPIVGRLYNGDLEKAAKNLEAAIGKEIGKSMSGVIWNDKQKSFNTTPDDIKSALSKIQAHKENSVKKAEFTQDQRVVKFAELLDRWSSEKK